MTLDGTVLGESADLVILGVTFDAKMTFEKHLRSVSSAAAQRLGIMRKSWQVFRDRSLLLRSFWSFVLPVLEYCSAVWCSAADSHLKLLDRVVVVVVVAAVPQRVCPSKPAPLKKSKQLAGECHRSSGLLMLCCVLMCVSAGQWVIMCVTVCADFVDGIIYSLSVSCQSSVMSAKKPAEVYSVRTWWCEF